jgi:hypothetical protein
MQSQVVGPGCETRICIVVTGRSWALIRQVVARIESEQPDNFDKLPENLTLAGSTRLKLM